MHTLLLALSLFSFTSWPPEHNDSLRLAVEHNVITKTVIGKERLNDGSIEDRMKAWNVRGLSVAVIDSGKIAWAKSYGLKNVHEPSSKPDTATLFQCASIGKIVTGLVALHLVGKGFVSLDEDVNDKLKSWTIPENDFTAKKKVTLRMLLSHSSGLTDGYGFMGYVPDNELPELLAILNARAPANNRKKLTVASIPGTNERYSGGGYIVIQQLIEDITGKQFEKLVDSIVFAPLGMTHSTYAYYPDEASKPNFAIAHQGNGNSYKKFNYRVYPEKAAAGFWTTASDLAKLIIAIQKNSAGLSNLIAKSLIKEMLTPQILSMGLGVHLKGDSSVTGFWHAGNNEGYTGILMATTETGQGAVVLTNSNSGEWLAMEILRTVAKNYKWPITLSFAPLPIPDMTEYFGTYVSEDLKSLEISAEKNQLYFRKAGSRKKFSIYQTKEDNFRIAEKPDNLLFIFKRNEQGKVTGLAMYENAGDSYLLLNKQ